MKNYFSYGRAKARGKAKRHPGRVQGCARQRTAATTLECLLQEMAKLQAEIPGCQRRADYSQYDSPDYYLISFVVSGTMAPSHQ